MCYLNIHLRLQYIPFAITFKKLFSIIQQDIIALLLEDNATFELPLEYRESLVSELKTPSRRMSDDGEVAVNISLDWQVLICNIIRDVLQGRPTYPGFLLSLRNCSQARLEVIFSVSIFDPWLLVACTCYFCHLPQMHVAYCEGIASLVFSIFSFVYNHCQLMEALHPKI